MGTDCVRRESDGIEWWMVNDEWWIREYIVAESTTLQSQTGSMRKKISSWKLTVRNVAQSSLIVTGRKLEAYGTVETQAGSLSYGQKK